MGRGSWAKRTISAVGIVLLLDKLVPTDNGGCNGSTSQLCCPLFSASQFPVVTIIEAIDNRSHYHQVERLRTEFSGAANLRLVHGDVLRVGVAGIIQGMLQQGRDGADAAASGTAGADEAAASAASTSGGATASGAAGSSNSAGPQQPLPKVRRGGAVSVLESQQCVLHWFQSDKSFLL